MYKLIMLWLVLIPLSILSQPVNDVTELKDALSDAMPGDTILLANGIWSNAQISLKKEGDANVPIVIRAETPGQVIFDGESHLFFSGTGLEFNGLVWQNVSPPYGEIVSFQTGGDVKVRAYHCRLTNCAIVDCNPIGSKRWVMVTGQDNRVDHNLFRQKTQPGQLLSIRTDPSGPSRHQIDHNIFEDVPANGGGNGSEIIQIGTAASGIPGEVIVEDNHLIECDGEQAEIISVKLDNNTIRRNVIERSQGALTLRSGNGNLVEANIFLGDDKPNTGGIRVHGSDQVIVNNHFQNLNESSPKYSPIALLTAGSITGEDYQQVDNCLIAHNTIYQCLSGLTVGYSFSSSPAGTPQNCTIANNIIHTPGTPIIDYNETPQGFFFEGNIFHRADGGDLGDVTSGYSNENPGLIMDSEGRYRIAAESAAVDAAEGSYPEASLDFDGQSRVVPDVGADEWSSEPIFDSGQIGPFWQNSGCQAGTTCNDGDPCTEDDQLGADCNCEGTFRDDDNDGICNVNDVCHGFDDTVDSDGDGIPDGCDSENCVISVVGSAVNLSSSARASGQVIYDLPLGARDVSFSVTGINAHRGYHELVTVFYTNATGESLIWGQLAAADGSDLDVTINEEVQQIMVILENAMTSGGKGQMKVVISDVRACVLPGEQFTRRMRVPDQSSLWPNPVSQRLNIDWNQFEQPEEVHVYSANGQRVAIEVDLRSKPCSIDVSQLSPGWYVVQIRNDTRYVSHKFLITR